MFFFIITFVDFFNLLKNVTHIILKKNSLFLIYFFDFSWFFFSFFIILFAIVRVF
jgi:hypothetical protein